MVVKMWSKGKCNNDTIFKKSGKQRESLPP